MDVNILSSKFSSSFTFGFLLRLPCFGESPPLSTSSPGTLSTVVGSRLVVLSTKAAWDSFMFRFCVISSPQFVRSKTANSK